MAGGVHGFVSEDRPHAAGTLVQLLPVLERLAAGEAAARGSIKRCEMRSISNLTLAAASQVGE